MLLSAVKLYIYWLAKLLFHERNARLYVTFLILRLVSTTDSCTYAGASDSNDGTTAVSRILLFHILHHKVSSYSRLVPKYGILSHVSGLWLT